MSDRRNLKNYIKHNFPMFWQLRTLKDYGTQHFLLFNSCKPVCTISLHA